MRIAANPLRPTNVKRDAPRVRPRSHDEVILQLPLVAVVDQVNAGINSFVLHLRVSRNVRPPLRRIVADEVVTRAGEFVRASNLGGGVGVAQLHPQYAAGHALRSRWIRICIRVSLQRYRSSSETRCPFRGWLLRCAPAQGEYGFVSREKKRVATRARKKLHAPIGLPVIGLEAQRQFAVLIENLGLSLWVGLGRTHWRHSARRRKSRARIDQ